ncbi:hypothetical protein BLNAU_12575 [Blattamonas nauphoetae]|uniref:Right handed beta helix domain-containing protein n=1 Tax=Blattamonas nauphoetae TaxID=2049346 RepID=A0ABQ9XLU9_9EUKA|nr:hypothetical protein BLNAU_12575 [Blattamonas nauphoetae]
MLFAVLFSTLYSLVDISTVLRSGSNADTDVVLLQDGYFSRDEKITDRWITLRTASSSSIRGVLGEMRTLFDVINSTLLVGEVDICVAGNYRIAEMEKNSFVSISSCTLDIGSDLSPFLSNGGDIVLSWISLTSPSLLPEMVVSPTHSCHLTVCGCTLDSATVGSSALFGCSSYTASVTSSRFSNVDHVIVTSPLSHGPGNTEPADFEHSCVARPLEGLQMNLASSSFWNVTDDLYGSITDAPISGKSFKLSHLHLRYSNPRRDLTASNADYTVPYLCRISLPILIEDCHFKDIDQTYGYALLIYCEYDFDVTVQSCTFTNIGERYAFSECAFRIEIPFVDVDDGIPPHVLVKDCSFVECAGYYTALITNYKGLTELINLTFKDCSPTYMEIYVMGMPADEYETRDIIIKNCLLENCIAEMVDGKYVTHLAGCFFVFHHGHVTICDKTTFRNCKGGHYSSIFSCGSLTMKQVRFEDCESAKSNGAGVIWTNKLHMEDVLVSKCRASTLPNGLLIRLSFDGMNSWPVAPNGEKSYEVKNCYIEHDDSGDYDHLDILFSIDASDLKDGKLDASKITNLHSNTDKFIVGVTTSAYSGNPDEAIPAFEDESAMVAKKGPDPRSDAETEEPGDDPEGPKLPIWALVVIIVGSVVIVAAVVVIIVVVVVVNKKKKAKTVPNVPSPSAKKGMGHEMEAQDVSNE